MSVYMCDTKSVCVCVSACVHFDCAHVSVHLCVLPSLHTVFSLSPQPHNHPYPMGCSSLPPVLSIAVTGTAPPISCESYTPRHFYSIKSPSVLSSMASLPLPAAASPSSVLVALL